VGGPGCYRLTPPGSGVADTASVETGVVTTDVDRQVESGSRAPPWCERGRRGDVARATRGAFAL